MGVLLSCAAALGARASCRGSWSGAVPLAAGWLPLRFVATWAKANVRTEPETFPGGISKFITSMWSGARCDGTGLILPLLAWI